MMRPESVSTRAQDDAGLQSREAAQGDGQLMREAMLLFWKVADGLVKRQLAMSFALVGISALLSALSPFALKLAVDGLSGEGTAKVLGPLAFVGLYVLSQYLIRACLEVRTLVYAYAEQRIRRQIARQLFEHIVRLPMQFHLNRKTGAIGETAEQGIRGYQLLLNHFVYTLLPVFIEFGVIAIVLIQLEHTAYLAILGVASVAYVWAFHHGAKSIQEPSKSLSTAHIEAHAVLTDSLLNCETVKYFDAEPVVCDRYDRALGLTESAWIRFFKSRAVNGMLVATIFALSLGFSLWWAASDVQRGAMTMGDFVLVNAYVVRLVTPLEMIGHAVRDIAQGLAFLQSLLALFREKREGETGKAAAQPVIVRGELRFENVSFSYRPERDILNNVSFFVPAGKTVAVVGVSGSGKSSLIRMLFRLYEPASGTIYLDGRPIADMPLSAVRQAIAIVPQDTVLFHDTLAANIGFGRFGSTQREIEEAARVAHLHDFIESLPEGYDTLVGERGLKLSGGERQRVAIARAALKRPRIFVFDEATSSLDSRTEREILGNLLDVSRRSTTLVIAHRLSTIVHADEILVLDKGVLVERGSHEDLRERGGAYTALWQAQQGMSVHQGASLAT